MYSKKEFSKNKIYLLLERIITELKYLVYEKLNYYYLILFARIFNRYQSKFNG